MGNDSAAKQHTYVDNHAGMSLVASAESVCICVCLLGMGPPLLLACKIHSQSCVLQEGGEDDKAEVEGGEGVQREVALLQARLRLLATYALVSTPTTTPCHASACG